MPGPVPAATKRRRNKPASDPLVVPPGAYSGKTPPLPNAKAYSARTRSWYESWRKSEQAGTFTTSTWMTLWMLADLVDSYFKKPTPAAWAQIKQTQAAMLAMPADQRRAGFTVDPTAPEEPPATGRGKKSPGTVTRIDARRQRLTEDAS